MRKALDWLKHFFNLQYSPLYKPMPSAFPAYAGKAISLITNSNGQLEDKQLLELFKANGIPAAEAVELLLFLPTAFCRYMLPRVEWPDYYQEYSSSRKYINSYYKENKRYIAMQAALQVYLAGPFIQDDYLKIASRDAEFKSLNQLLAAGGKLENAVISPAIIMR